MTLNKPMAVGRSETLASLSLDLDNQWSYLKIHGDPGWESFPSYLDVVVPRVLAFLQERQLTITVFIVGQDAALPKNQAAIRAIADAGHEIGNHSFHHDSWLHLYSEAEIETEIAEAERQIEQVTGHRPRGFRGPGYSFSATVLKVLAQRGYDYDASTFPTYLGPLARAYYFMTSNLSREEREQRKQLFGGFKDGLQSLHPYWWHTVAEPLLEIPVTTMPIFKIPIHFSYILYLGRLSAPLALLYFRIALGLCKLTKTSPSLLLHPLDFLSSEDVPDLSFFPGMGLSLERKQWLLASAIDLLDQQFTLVPLGQYAHHLANSASQRTLKRLEPRSVTAPHRRVAHPPEIAKQP